MTTLTFIAEHGCLSSAISGSVDAFSIANLLWQFMEKGKDKALFKTEVVTIDGKQITANGNIVIQPDKAIFDIKKTDMIIIPAFFLPFDTKNKRIKIFKGRY